MRRPWTVLVPLALLLPIVAAVGLLLATPSVEPTTRPPIVVDNTGAGTEGATGPRKPRSADGSDDRSERNEDRNDDLDDLDDMNEVEEVVPAPDTLGDSNDNTGRDGTGSVAPAPTGGDDDDDDDGDDDDGGDD